MIRRLKGGTKRIIHVVGQILADNRERGEDRPAIAIRSEKDPETILYMSRHVEVLGPSYICHTPYNPIPGTEGRAVYVLRTSAPLRLHLDEEA